MKTSIHVSLAALLASLILVSSAFAQKAPTPPGLDDDADDTGLLGHPYLQIDTNLYQFRNVDFPAPTGLGADTKLNFGVTDNFDLGMKYGFLHARNTNWRVSDQVATVYGTGFYHFKNFTPYVTTGIGYGWERSTMLVDIPEEGPHYTRTVVDVGTGVEIPIVAQTSVTLGVDFGEGFRRPHPTDWTYQSALNYNFDDLFGVGGGIDYQEGNKGSHNALVYHLGFRLMFD